MMKDKKALIGVKEKDDDLKWSELNCFYRTFAVALNYINERYYDVYLLFITAYVSFVIKGERSLSFDGNDYTIKYFNDELNDIFNGNIVKNIFTSKRDMRIKFKNQLKKNKPIIVPVDLFYLPYCKTYKEQHRRHYLIVNGIDFGKNICYITDNMHNNLGADTRYSEFMVSIDIVYEMSRSFCKYFDNICNHNYFWSIEVSDNTCFVNESSKYLTRICKKIIELSENEWFESEYLNGNADTDIVHYMKFYNTKTTFYKLVDRYIMKSYLPSDNLLMTHDFIINMINEREKLKIEFALKSNLVEKETGNSVERLINDEKAALKKVIHIINDEKLAEIATVRRENVYSIVLNDDRTYDIWRNVNNGKVIIVKEGVDKSGLEISMNVEAEFGGSYHAGIYIEFENGDKLLFGTLGKMNTAIHCIGENPDYELYMKKEPFENEIKYKILFDGMNIRFYSNHKEIYEVSKINEIKEYGIFAKSWEKCKASIMVRL